MSFKKEFEEYILLSEVFHFIIDAQIITMRSCRNKTKKYKNELLHYHQIE
jgi:hypothetical protein